MKLIEIILTGIGLSMDAFAVAVAGGLALRELKVRHAFRIALFFGLFQAFMPAVGWLAGITLSWFIQGAGPWIAFGLLTGIGVKMIYEASVIREQEKKLNLEKSLVLLTLSVATSIDALSVGVTFAFRKIDIAAPVLIIGSITFILSFAGVYLGEKTGHFFEDKLEIAGGLILIGIGVKILLVHLLG